MSDLNGVSASNIASTRGRCYGKFWNVVSRLWRTTSRKKTRFLSDFTSSKAAWNVRRRAKPKEVWFECRKKLVFEIRTLSPNLLKCWKFRLGLARVFWRQSEHASDFRQICTLSTEWGAGGGWCQYMRGSKERLERDPEFLSKIITSDEIWVDEYDIETNTTTIQAKFQDALV